MQGEVDGVLTADRRWCLHSGIAKLRYDVEQGLLCAGVSVESRANRQLVLDAPWGWAESWFRSPRTERDGVVVVTDNPCPEYRLNLVEQEPIALLTAVSLSDIVRALIQVNTGARHVPHIPTPLTSGERKVLQLVAKGYRNKEVAAERGVSEGRIKNVVRDIYLKLGLNSQVSLVHYYYGNWLVLLENGWEPPLHARNQRHVIKVP